MKKAWKVVFNDELSYKIVAFFIAIILWLTILGRRDFVLTKVVPIDFITPTHYALVNKPIKEIEVKVSGPRGPLQKFARQIETHSVTFDLAKYPVGKTDLDITKERFEVPLGVKIISITPSQIPVVIKENK